MIDMSTNPWQVLGVHRASSLEEVKTAYKAAMKQHHPDVGGTEEKAAELTTCYKVLTNPMLTRSYIATLSVLGHPCHVCNGRGYAFKQKGLTDRVTSPCPHCGGRGILVKDGL